MKFNALLATLVLAGAAGLYFAYLILAPVEGELPGLEAARAASDGVLGKHVVQACPGFKTAGEPEHVTAKLFEADRDERAYRFVYSLAKGGERREVMTIIWQQSSRWKNLRGQSGEMIADVVKGCGAP